MSIFCWSNFSLPKSHWQPHIVNKTFHKYPHRDHHTSMPNWKSSLELPGMIYNRHRPQNEEAVWTIPAGRKYPLGEGFKQVVALIALKDKWGKVQIALQSSPSMPSNPTQSMCWLQALHGNEAKVVDLLCPNPSAGHKTPSCLRTAWDT